MEKIWETEKSKTLRTEIVEYSQNHLNSNSLNHLDGLLAMKKSGEQRELSNFVSKQKEATGDKNLKSALALALYQQDTNGL